MEAIVFPKIIKKRNGKIAAFSLDKMAEAIRRAAIAAGDTEANSAAKSLAEKAAGYLAKEFCSDNIPTVNDSGEACCKALIESGYTDTARRFKSYSDGRARVRNFGIKVRKDGSSNLDITDQMLLVQSSDCGAEEKFDRQKLADYISREYKVEPVLAEMLAKETENTLCQLAERYGSKTFNTHFLRKILESHILMMGIPVKKSSLSMPVSTMETLVTTNSKENSNITSNNPEAVNLGIAEYILKQYSLKHVYSDEVADAHNSGMIHIHDLGYPQRVYCSSHSIEYIKRYGLDKIVSNLQNKSKPAKSASVLIGHIQTFLASMQSRYAGALGFGFLNILFAPMLYRPKRAAIGTLDGKPVKMPLEDLEDLIESGIACYSHDKKSGCLEFVPDPELNGVNPYMMFPLPEREVHQMAQNLIFSASQNAFSRGGQTLFIDFNIHTGVPEYMRNVPVVGPGGKYLREDKNGWIEFDDDAPRFKGKDGDSRNGDAAPIEVPEGSPDMGWKYITYGDPRMVKMAQQFALDLIDVWKAGDKHGVQFSFPKCDLHISKDTLSNPEELKIFKAGCDLASVNGSTYFMFDRDGGGATLAQCCRLKEKVTDPDMLKHPEKIRFTGFQNVTINLPQAAYRGKTLNGMLIEIDKAMELAMRAHLDKKSYIQSLLDTDGSPLRSLGVDSDDGEPYINLDKSTYIIGLIGLNEAVQWLTGYELHENSGAYDLGLRIVDHMYQNVQNFRKEYGLKVTIEETPAESTTQKLAKGDLIRYPELKKVIKGDLRNAPYYTNSVHMNPGANISIIDRIDLQSRFHEMIESGSIIHVYCGENRIPSESIETLISRSFLNTRASQITVSPEFTHCNNCHKNVFGFVEKCASCGSTDVTKRTKIVGYFSNLSGWNASQLEISRAREKAARQYADFGSHISWMRSFKDGVYVFGKPGCATCEDAKKQLTRLIPGKCPDMPFEFVDLTTENGRIMAARFSVALDPIPTVAVVRNGKLIKHELSFRRGKPVRWNATSYESFLSDI